ncbi:hypothetical protein AAVH_28294 [Aphelenchoides avenae]|nr:hypothetical protein AAVH_28294 [Aphelenchus avenae]
MPFDQRKWDDLCRAELQTLRNGEEAAEFHHMRAHFEVICRRMLDAQPQPSSFFSGQPARPFAGQSRSFGARGSRGGRGGYANNAQGGRRPEKRHVDQLTQQLKRARIESGTAGAGTAGVKSQVVVPRDSVLIVTNDDVTQKMFVIKQNIQEFRCATIEELKAHLDGMDKVDILVVVWKGEINPLDLEAISGAAAGKSKFHRLLTETEDENSVDVRDVHRKLPSSDLELENVGRSVLKAAQNAGLRPTRFPVQ